MVIYFSATGTTARAAEKIAWITGSKVERILPAEPYSAEDLNWHDRSTVEQNQPDARPAIKNKIELDSDELVFIGYPIWWYGAPKIMETLVESMDFSGKKVIPFCTSGGSSIGDSGQKLSKLAKNGDWLEGTRIKEGMSDEDIRKCLAKIGVSV